MSKLMNEQVASYIYDKNVPYGTYNVFACYSNLADYSERKVDFFDVYDENGLCVNEGDPFYELPSWQNIYDFYYLPSLKEADQDRFKDLKFV